MKARPMISIVNCKRGSFAWFHEKRHAVQERRWGLLSAWCVVDECLRLLAVLAVVVQDWFLTSLFVYGLFFANALLEFDADLYALKMTGNWRAWLRLSDVNKVVVK